MGVAVPALVKKQFQLLGFADLMTWRKRLMVRPEFSMSVHLCREPVDMRKSIDGLSLLVQEAMALNPFDEEAFVFSNRQSDKVKVLAWERNGFVLWYKRLERE
ncbi:MAG: IS66 family insertion sequence element accessory protein TnpB [Marinobacter sp.]|uniref:IS66 family insertion sequence element accessory protein TnpB n=1 Tax=Marinobacter sp. TaxID=50741 RepID=UPI003F9C3C1B